MSTNAEGRAPGRLQVMTRVVGLSIACPFSQDNPQRCQLCEVRTLPMAERIDWVRGLSVEELHGISIGHESCLKALERLADKADRNPEL